MYLILSENYEEIAGFFHYKDAIFFVLRVSQLTMRPYRLQYIHLEKPVNS